MTTIDAFEAKSLDGTTVPLSTWKGRVRLVVNTASRCGFTPQYAGLEALQQEYGPRGLTVLGFPCNQFGAQEPGEAAEIRSFCDTRFGVSFPLFAKIEVNGPEAHPLYVWLKREAPGLLGLQAIKWNFTKFLVDRSGSVVARFAPSKPPEALRDAIERLL